VNAAEGPRGEGNETAPGINDEVGGYGFVGHGLSVGCLSTYDFAGLCKTLVAM
jgi:hypothetical protein